MQNKRRAKFAKRHVHARTPAKSPKMLAACPRNNGEVDQVILDSATAGLMMGTLSDHLSIFASERRHPSDQFFALGDSVCKTTVRQGVLDIDEEELCHQMVLPFSCHVLGCKAVFDTLLQFELHYNSLHRYSCAECRKQLPSAHLLDLHLAETHDSFFKAQAEHQPMYACFVEQCTQRSQTPVERRDHCISEHKFPHDFRYDAAPKQKAKMQGKNRGRGCGNNRMWHSRKPSSAKSATSVPMDVEFSKVAEDIRASLPDEMS